MSKEIEKELKAIRGDRLLREILQDYIEKEIVLQQENEQLRTALKHIIEHLDTVPGILVEPSAVKRMAQDALADSHLVKQVNKGMY